MSSPMKKALEGANKSLDAITTAHSREAAQIYSQAHDKYLATITKINTSYNTFVSGLFTLVLGKLQLNLLKTQLNHEKEIENQKRDLIQQQIDLAKSARDDYLNSYKPIESDYLKIVKDSVKKAYKPNYDFIAGRMSNAAYAAFIGQEQKIKETTSGYSSGGLAYKLTNLAIAKANAASDAANKGYLYEDNKKIRLDQDMLNRVERTSVQGNAVKNRNEANFAGLAAMLQPDVSGAQSSYGQAIGALSGSVYGLISGLTNFGGGNLFGSGGGNGNNLDAFSESQNNLLMWN